ncbi:MAG: hypothetical protein L3K24_11375 [Gammaproteobacteria bacterium]|nr:hypothetical protein [Gammaproteobacteria bacterium]
MLNSIKRGELESHIAWAKVEFSTTGKVVELETKENSVCHFFEPFDLENDSIVLRLDWSDPDTHGNPTLDADFYNKNTKKKRTLKGEMKKAHHTQTAKPGERIYCWKFKGYEKPFKVMIGWLMLAKATVGVSCLVEIEVIKGNQN